MANFKNISGVSVIVPGVGTVEPEAVVELSEDFHNGNFERVEEKKDESRKKRSASEDEEDGE